MANLKDMMIGKVTKILDPLKFRIEFTSKGVIEDMPARAFHHEDQPVVGEEVMVYELETIYGYSYFWEKIRLMDHTLFHIDDTKVDIYTNKVEVVSGSSKVTIQKDGDIEVDSATKVLVKAPQVEITGGQLTTKGSAAPTSQGPFCAIPVCPLTGAPHIGHQVSGT